MIKLLTLIICIFLSVIILLQTPRKNIGLSSSAGNSINIITVLGILMYLSLAIRLNLVANT